MKKLLLFTCIIIILPAIIVNIFAKTEKLTLRQVTNNTIKVMDESNKIVKEIPLEEYVKGVISGEMPVSFEIEALKAQAVASRSYVLYQKEHKKNSKYDVVNTTKNQVYLTDKQLKQKWGNAYLKNINKITKAIIETRGQYLEYKGKIVEALFFSTSTGKTENSEEVFSSKLPYLRSVSSNWDEDSPVFEETKTYDIKIFNKKLKINNKKKLKIKIEKTTTTGRIKKIKINNKTFTGTEIEKLLSLRSNYFKITQNQNKITIITKGFGHGVGMSQYGAQGMAKEGNNYKKILKYYYKNVKIKKL